mgnify:CR=1 FL=1
MIKNFLPLAFLTTLVACNQSINVDVNTSEGPKTMQCYRASPLRSIEGHAYSLEWYDEYNNERLSMGRYEVSESGETIETFTKDITFSVRYADVGDALTYCHNYLNP